MAKLSLRRHRSIDLDAATGAGEATLELAKRIAEAGGGGKVISVDTDLEAFPYAKGNLGEFARFVEFVEADLTCMPQIESVTLSFAH